MQKAAHHLVFYDTLMPIEEGSSQLHMHKACHEAFTSGCWGTLEQI